MSTTFGGRAPPLATPVIALPPAESTDARHPTVRRGGPRPGVRARSFRTSDGRVTFFSGNALTLRRRVGGFDGQERLVARTNGDGVDDPGQRARRPLIVVHLMKTGGFSLLYQVMRNVRPAATWGVPDERLDEIERMASYSSVEQLRTLDDDARARLEVVVGHLPFAAVDVAGFDQPTTATVVRDPVDRVLSYLNMCKERNVEHRDLALEQIYEDTFFGPRTIGNHQTKMLGMTAEQATTRPPAPEEPPPEGLVEYLFAQGYFDSPQFLE